MGVLVGTVTAGLGGTTPCPLVVVAAEADGAETDEVGALITGCLTVIPDCVPMIAAALVSIAVIDCEPAVLRMTLKVCMPASAGVNV